MKTAENQSIMEDQDAYTPEQFKADGSVTNMTTDEQGNRNSILPGSSRPSKVKSSSDDKEDKVIASFAESAQPVKKTMLETYKEENAQMKTIEPAKQTR